jgi:hypothetical protein
MSLERSSFCGIWSGIAILSIWAVKIKTEVVSFYGSNRATNLGPNRANGNDLLGYKRAENDKRERAGVTPALSSTE